MKNEINVRQLALNDLNDFFNLRLESLQNSPASFLFSYEEEKNSGPAFYENILKSNSQENVIFGAFVENSLVGIMGVYQSANRRLQHKATLWGTYVSPQYRGLNIAKKLIELVINHAKNKMQCLILNLSVGTQNIPAKQLYESFGFVKWGTEPKGILIDDKFIDEDHIVLHLK